MQRNKREGEGGGGEGEREGEACEITAPLSFI